MATKRFTDAEKWKDPFFENLTNNFKLIWLYLLDDCDNAGLWSKSMKRLNFHCDTNVTEEELLQTLNNKIIVISDSTWFIPKFLEFQYSADWINKNSLPIQSVKNKLSIKGIDIESIPYRYSNDTVSIQLDNTIDSTKDKDKVKDKVQDKSKDLSKEQSKDKSIIDSLQAIVSEKLNIKYE